MYFSNRVLYYAISHKSDEDKVCYVTTNRTSTEVDNLGKKYFLRHIYTELNTGAQSFHASFTKKERKKKKKEFK